MPLTSSRARRAPSCSGARQQPHRALGGRHQVLERLAGIEPRQVARHRADRRRDRHLVVVQDDEQPFLHVAGVVHRLVGHARRHRAVADHADHVADVGAPRSRATAKPRPGRDRGRGMRRAEGVVGALGPPGEAARARRRRAASGCGRAGRSGSCADRPGGRRPRSACPWGVLKTAWIATVSSTTPRPAPRCPPVTDTAEIVSARSSSASWRSSPWSGP